MALSNEQRGWLEKAIQIKGRLTTRRGVRKQLDEYLRRREKTAKAVAALPDPNPNKANIVAGLKHADALAKDGKLKDAYAYLENIKTLAKAEATGRGQLIMNDAIRNDANNLARDFGAQVMECKSATAGVIDLFGVIKVAPKAGDCATLDEAITFRTNFVAEEVRLRGLFTAAKAECVRINQTMTARNLKPRIDQLAMDIAAVQATGRGSDVAPFEKVLKDIQAKWGSDDGLYSDPKNVRLFPSEREMELEQLISNCKSFGKLQSREGEDIKQDDKVDAVRGDLKRDDAARLKLLEREEERLKRARAELKITYLVDDIVLSDTSTSVGVVTPELPSFVPGDVFDDLAADIDLGDVVSDGDRDTIAASVADKLKTFATDAGTNKYELFDLTLKSKSELKEMIARDILGTTNPADWTPTQGAMLDEAVAKAEQSLSENLPNRIEPDGSKVKVGDAEYKNPVVLKEGGNGKATRYTDDLGNSIVVKTLLRGNEKEREKMVREMETHMRAMSGRDPAVDDGLVEMKGAARSEDGSLHMIMEDVKGGDLHDLNNGMAAASWLGLIPEAARQAIAMNNLLDTVRALKDLERQGLVHHDIKGENVMMTSDGKIKIIDFGESGFVGDDGVLRDHQGGTTGGYEAREAVFDEPEKDTKIDLYAMSGMLQRMVGGIVPSLEFNEKKMETGVLGRVVGALSDPDPKKRPSLDAILNSSLATSYEQDYNPENVKKLQAASLDFSMQAVHVEGPVDVANLSGEVSTSVGKQLTDPMKLKTAQQIAVFLEGKLVTQLERAKKDPKWFTVKGGDEEIKQLQNDIAVIQAKIVNPMLEGAVAEGENAYANAVNDPNLKFDIALGDKTANVTLKQAVGAREKLVARVKSDREKVMLLLNDVEESDDLQNKLDAFNAKITGWDETRKGIDDAIYEAVGPKAKFFLAKVKMENAAAAFGPSGSPETEQGVKDETGLEQLVSDITTADVRTELKEKAAT